MSGKKGTKLVIDNSVVMTWAFEDEINAYADKVLESLNFATCVVPEIWPLEVVNVLALAERKGRLSEGESLRFVSLLETLPIEISLECDIHGMRNLLSIARDFKLTSYDASYLSLALNNGLPLATLDRSLRKAAKKANIDLF